MQGLAPGHKFLVYLDNIELSFSKISGIGNEIDIQSINEGGINDHMITLYGPPKNNGRLVFEHGKGIVNLVNKNFTAAALGIIFRSSGMIISYDNNKIKRAYGYTGAIPVKWSLASFDAQNGSVLIDTVEVVHNGIYEIPYAANF